MDGITLHLKLFFQCGPLLHWSRSDECKIQRHTYSNKRSYANFLA